MVRVDNSAPSECQTPSSAFSGDQGAEVMVEETEIPREQATAIGAIEIVTRGLGHGARIAMALDEIERPPNIYNVDLRSCWIVYATQTLRGLKRNSIVVVVARRDGAVLYAGSANDQ
jgi:hypothetical protein